VEKSPTTQENHVFGIFITNEYRIYSEITIVQDSSVSSSYNEGRLFKRTSIRKFHFISKPQKNQQNHISVTKTVDNMSLVTD
jgi:hypothetical protein